MLNKIGKEFGISVGYGGEEDELGVYVLRVSIS